MKRCRNDPQRQTARHFVDTGNYTNLHEVACDKKTTSALAEGLLLVMPECFA
jgi:hypothetical protein